MQKEDVLEILDDIVEMYVQFDCSLEDCIEWAREVVKDDGNTKTYTGN